MKVVATVEARMASSRLPGKVLRQVVGVPLLGHLINRLKYCQTLNDIVVATSTNPLDDELVEYCRLIDIPVFRGDEIDVMGRVLAAATFSSADLVVETTGDNPMLDPDIVDFHVDTFLANKADYVSNTVFPSFPDGMDVQVFMRKTLALSERATSHPLDREHVTRHIRMHPDLFTRINVLAPIDIRRPDLSVTVDEPSDFDVVRLAFESLYDESRPFSCRELVAYFDAHPEIALKNALVNRKGTEL